MLQCHPEKVSERSMFSPEQAQALAADARSIQPVRGTGGQPVKPGNGQHTPPSKKPAKKPVSLASA